LRFDAELWQLVNDGARLTRLTASEFTRQAIRKGAPAVIRALAPLDLSPLTAAEWKRVNAVMKEDAAEVGRLAAKSALPTKDRLDQ
jgi:hypothetical protein